LKSRHDVRQVIAVRNDLAEPLDRRVDPAGGRFRHLDARDRDRPHSTSR
jgi:hypothetical protein